MRTLLLALGGLVVVLAAAFVLAFRAKAPALLGVVRRFNRDHTNRRQLAGDAGRPGAYASVVHHVGRRTGTAHRTPVVAVPVDDGFLFALPYGPTTDWVRNLLAAGGGRVVHDGVDVDVTRPRVVDLAETAMARRDRLVHRAFGVREALRVDRTA